MESRLFKKQPADIIPELRSKSDQFRDVFAIILKQDLKALTARIENGLPLAINEGGHTPASLIAAKGKFGHINWYHDALLSIPFSEAILGYASAGYDEAAHSYAIISKCSKSEEAEAFGYGLSGNPDHLTRFYDKTTFGLNERLAYLEGLACGGHETLIQQVYDDLNHSKADERVLFGLARGGHLSLLSEWQQQIGTSKETDASIVFGLSAAGKPLDAFKYSQHLSQENFINILCHGLAYGGHMDRVEIYLDQAKKNTDLDVFERRYWDAIQGYGEGGHLYNEKLVVRVLSHALDHTMRQKYARMIQAMWHPALNIEEACNSAGCMQTLMQQHVSYENALLHYHPLVQEAKGQGLTLR